MPFQTTVLTEPAPGLIGGWCSANVHTSMVNPNNGDPTSPAYTSWQVGPNGLTVGRFCFADTATGLVYPSHPGTSTVRVGFVHRYQPVLINAYLTQIGSTMNPGQEVDITDSGDFWMQIPAGSGPGPKLFASFADGSAIPGTVGGTVTGTAVTANTTNGSPNLANVSGPLSAGQPVSGTGIPAGTYIITGAATGGTAVMSANATATGAAVSVTPTTAIETRWYVDALSPAGGISKTSTRG